MSMISLVYISVTPRHMSDDDLTAILEVSRRNNPKRGITGMLLYKDRFFIQALEGERESVYNLYEKIHKDPRHINAVKIYEHEISERSFKDWSMGFNKLDTQEMPAFTGFLTASQDARVAHFKSQPSQAVALLERFRTQSTL